MCHQVDPRDFGINDPKIFRQLETADVLVVDGQAGSYDYYYSLGVRHALSRKPTFVLLEQERIYSDISIPRGIIEVAARDLRERAHELRMRLVQEFKAAADVISHSTSFSPVRDALESVPRVFMSYSHEDSESVFAVDQWLRDRGVRVDIDARTFLAGQDVRGEIVRWMARSDKVICFFSARSRDRYYTKLERRLAEERERVVHGKTSSSILLYFRLDDSELPSEYSHRLAINAWKLTFEQACEELWRHVVEEPAEPIRQDLSKYTRKPPWKRSTVKKG